MTIGLFDIDSLFYYSVWNIVNFGSIRDCYKTADRILYRDGIVFKPKDEDWFNDFCRAIVEYSKMSEFDKLLYCCSVYAKRRVILFEWIVDEAFGRMSTKLVHIYEHIEKSGVKLGPVEFYITRCRRSIRKQISPFYKSNRKPNKYVNEIRARMIDEGTAIYDDELEADDLIADRAKELKSQGQDYIIISIDKDLKQIPGKHFDYYAIKAVNPETNEKIFVRYKGLSFTSNFDSYEMLAKQMLMGDSGDRVVGLKGVGPVTAGKILSGVTKPKQFIKIVYREYINHWSVIDHKKEFMINLRLLKLGRSLLIE